MRLAAASCVNGDPEACSSEAFTLATKQMLVSQTSFKLQFLDLQKEMQHENRVFTSVSNIMKAKHDVIKSAFSNTR
jgi:hypothetical protein